MHQGYKCMSYYFCCQDIRKTFEELRPLLKRGATEKFEVLTGAGDDVKDTNMLSLIQRLYQLSGEAKVGSSPYTMAIGVSPLYVTEHLEKNTT